MANTRLQLGFYSFSKKVLYRGLLDCSVNRYNMTDFLGWGIRKGGDGCTLCNNPGHHLSGQ